MAGPAGPKLFRAPRALRLRLEKYKLKSVDRESRPVLTRLRNLFFDKDIKRTVNELNLPTSISIGTKEIIMTDHYVDASSTAQSLFMPLMTFMTFLRAKRFFSDLLKSKQTPEPSTETPEPSKKTFDLGFLTSESDGTSVLSIGKGEMLAQRGPLIADESVIETLKAYRRNLKDIYQVLNSPNHESLTLDHLRGLFKKWRETNLSLTTLIAQQTSPIIYETLNVILGESDTIYFALQGIMSKVEGRISNMNFHNSLTDQRNIGKIDLDIISLLVGLKPVLKVTFDAQDVFAKLKTYYPDVTKMGFAFDGVHTGYPGLFLLILRGFMQHAIESDQHESAVPLRLNGELTGNSLTLRGNGIGYSFEELPHIFGPKANMTEGAKTGLAIMFRAIALYGGDITVRSKKGEFTEFRTHLGFKAANGE